MSLQQPSSGGKASGYRAIHALVGLPPLHYVDDASGIVDVGEQYDEPEPVNLGTGQEVRERELVELIAELTSSDGDISWDTRWPGGQPRRALNTRRARELFGFGAAIGLEEGLRRTLDWGKREARRQ